jgi:ABC-type antimicrobial peptide transport system permease subunit
MDRILLRCEEWAMQTLLQDLRYATRQLIRNLGLTITAVVSLALGLALAAVGLYSVVSYTVAQRTNEFGIRMALGAGPGHVLRIVFASTLVSVGGGVLCGLALTLGLNKIVAQWADGNAHDPIVLLEGTLLLGVVAGIACAIPARRAARVDPMTALRCD